MSGRHTQSSQRPWSTGKPITKHTIKTPASARSDPSRALELSADDIAFASMARTLLRSSSCAPPYFQSIGEELADAWNGVCPRRCATRPPEPEPEPALETDHVNGFDYFRIFDDRRRLLVPNVGQTRLVLGPSSTR